jgi:hypothetical protein
MKCIFCEKELVQLVVSDYYPTCLKKDLDIIRIWGNIFIAKLMLKNNKTHVWKHSDGTFQTVLQVKSLLNINPENIDSKIKSLLVFT